MARNIPLPRRRVVDGRVHYHVGKSSVEFQSDAQALEFAKATLTDDVWLALGIIAAARLRAAGQTPAQISAKSLAIELDSGTSVGIA